MCGEIKFVTDKKKCEFVPCALLELPPSRLARCAHASALRLDIGDHVARNTATVTG